MSRKTATIEVNNPSPNLTTVSVLTSLTSCAGRPGFYCSLMSTLEE